MGTEINQSTFDELQSYVSTGNYTQFYTTLYQNGSTISGLYIPGPTGQGVFGNYSHAHVGDVIGTVEFEQERERVSNTIATGLLESISATRDGSGNYQILTDVEFLQREISIFTNDLGYPTEAYPGHDLIDLVNLDVPGATEGITVVEALQSAISAVQQELETHVSVLGQDMMTIDEAVAAGAVFDEASGYYFLDGQVMDFHVGVFQYKGELFDSKDLIEQDGILYVRTDLFSEDGEFELLPVGLPTNEVINSIVRLYENSGGQSCFGAEVPIDMWPLDPDLTSGLDGLYDQDAVRAKIWRKPIEAVVADDVVVSFDENGNLVPGRVTRTFRNDAKIVLDFFGTGVTPGHVYYRADSDKAHKFETLIDILRSDGVIQNQEGTLIRAATGLPVDDVRDGYVQVVTGQLDDGGRVVIRDQGKLRLGTRFISDDGKDVCVADLITAGGGVVDEDGLICVGECEPMPFHWTFSAVLPKPEDYILQRSGTTLEDIYKAAEWEDQRPVMPAPMIRDGGVVQPLSEAGLALRPRNTPLAMREDGYADTPRPMLNRKKRKALEAQQRKSGKRSARIVH